MSMGQPNYLIAEESNGVPNLGGKRRLAGTPEEAFADALSINGRVYALEPVDPTDINPLSASTHVSLVEHVDVLPVKKRSWRR